MSLSSTAMSPGSPASEVRAEVNKEEEEEEEEETKEITLNRESMLVNILAIYIYTNFHLKKSCLSTRRYITFLFQDDLHVEKLYPVRKRYLGFLNLKRWEIFYYQRQNRILQDYSRKVCLQNIN